MLSLATLAKRRRIGLPLKLGMGPAIKPTSAALPAPAALDQARPHALKCLYFERTPQRQKIIACRRSAAAR